MKKRSASIPRVEFLIPSPAREARVLSMFLGPQKTGWNMGDYISLRHPELGEQVRGLTDHSDIYRQCYRYAKAFRRAHEREYAERRARQEADWRTIESRFLETLSHHFETKYPAKRNVIRAYVSMVPIYPRWIDTWSFNVSYFNPARVKSIACHEILHFLYFKKWAEVFPDTPHEHFNAPHLVWRLSEILDPIILNEHPTLRELVDAPQSTYVEFDHMRIAGVRPFTHFTRLHRHHLKSGELHTQAQHVCGHAFADFLREAWAEAQKYEKVLMGA